VFRHDPLNPNTISDNYIRTLFIDSKGRLWIGTYSGVYGVKARFPDPLARGNLERRSLL
jgi:ligand-binding sensor domain-containing protein